MSPGDCFGMPSHFRLGFATTGERFQTALERFNEFLGTEAHAATTAAQR